MVKLNNDRLAKAIESKRFPLSLDKISTITGVSKATLSRVENGRTPDVETFYAICQWLGMPMEEFFKEGVNCNPCNPFYPLRELFKIR